METHVSFDCGYEEDRCQSASSDRLGLLDYEFGAMSATVKFRAVDDKVAVAAALWWGNGFPLLVCYSDENLSPAKLFGTNPEQHKLLAFFGVPLGEFLDARSEDIAAAIKTMEW